MDEEHPLNPRSPYAATKAGADRLVYSYVATYDLPAVILRPFNNYGPYQHPEKVIPRFITAGAAARPLTVHGGGTGEPRLAVRRGHLPGDRGDHRRAARARRGPDDQRRHGRRHRRADHRRAHLRLPRQAALTDRARAGPPRPGRPPHRLDRAGRRAARLAGPHRLRRGPRAHDPLVRDNPAWWAGMYQRASARRPAQRPIPSGLCWCSAPGPGSSARYGPPGGWGRRRRLRPRPLGVLRARGADRPLRARLVDGRGGASSDGSPARRAAGLICARHRPAGAPRRASRRRGSSCRTRSTRCGRAGHRQAAAAAGVRRRGRAAAALQRGRHGTPGRRARCQGRRRPGPARPDARRAGRRRRGGGCAGGAAASPTGGRSSRSSSRARRSRSTRSTTTAASSRSRSPTASARWPSAWPRRTSTRRGTRSRTSWPRPRPPARRSAIAAGPELHAGRARGGRPARDGGRRAPRRRP